MVVLESWMKEACEIYLQSSGSSPGLFLTADTSDDLENNVEKELSAPPRIPKVFNEV